MGKIKNQYKTLIKPSSSEMCPPGYHVVQGHKRVCESGTATWVDAHIRKNREKIRPGLLKENIHFLFWNSKKKYPILNEIKGFEGLGAEFDPLIQFWLDYWKAQGIEFPKDLDPLIVKAMIAVESTFDPSKITKATAPPQDLCRSLTNPYVLWAAFQTKRNGSKCVNILFTSTNLINLIQLPILL